MADDGSANEDNAFHAITCLACRRVHLVDPTSGKVAAAASSVGCRSLGAGSRDCDPTHQRSVPSSDSSANRAGIITPESNRAGRFTQPGVNVGADLIYGKAPRVWAA